MDSHEDYTETPPAAETRPGFFSVLIGLVTEPRATTERLFSLRPPPFALSLFVVLVASVFGPILAQYFRYEASAYRLDALLSLCLVFGFSIPLFVLIETIGLLLLGVEVRLAQVAAAVSYALTPVSFIILLFYGSNYLNTGRMSLINFLLEGARSSPDPFMTVLPWALGITAAIVFVVFYYCIRIIGGLQPFSAAFMLLFSVAPAAAALRLALYIGDQARPGTSELLWKVVANPASLTYFVS